MNKEDKNSEEDVKERSEDKRYNSYEEKVRRYDRG